MQTLLPSERFEYVVNLQPMEIKNKNLPSAGVFNEDITSAVDPTEPHAKPQSPTTSAVHRPGVSEFSTLPEVVKEAN